MSHDVEPPTDSSRSDSGGPLKIKVYGFLPLTRSGYLIVQVVLYVAMVLLMLGLKPLVMTFQVFELVYDHLAAFLVVVALLELGETYFVLRKFKAKRQQMASRNDSSA